MEFTGHLFLSGEVQSGIRTLDYPDPEIRKRFNFNAAVNIKFNILYIGV